MEPGLSTAQFNNHFADFPHIKATEVDGCEVHIKGEEIWEALKPAKDKTPGID